MIRLFKASANYGAFLDYVYEKSPGLKDRSYEDHINQLYNFCFAESNFFKLNLEKKGNYIVEEVVCNDELLQKKWAAENNVSYTKDNWYVEVVEAQILRFRPNVFFAHDHKCLDSKFISRLRKLVPELKLVLGWDGIDLADEVLFSAVDCVLTPADFITQHYLEKNKTSYTLPFAFEESILNRLSKESVQDDVCFVGSVFLRKNGHFQRKKLLKELAKTTNINLYLSGSVNIFKQGTLKAILSLLKRNTLQDIADLVYLSRRSKGSLYGIDMYQKFYNSKIVINNHIDAAGDMAANIRLFESTGTGSCLLTDYKENIEDYFEIDKEIVVYKNAEDCAQKVNYLLANETKRLAIAEAGQHRTLTQYNYKVRMDKLDSIIKTYL